MIDKHDEAEYVNQCPVCETELIGMTPAEYRAEHVPQCDPLADLYHFRAKQ